MDAGRLDDMGLAAHRPMTGEEVLAVLAGHDLHVFRAERIECDMIAKDAKRYKRIDPSEWPSLDFNWDFSPEAQRFALDGCTAECFAKDYPRGLRLGWAVLEEFDAKLSRQNRRDRDELWDVGDEDKLTWAIEYIRRGKPITPPLVAALTQNEQVCLVGGNHRYTVAKFSSQSELPIYVDPDEAEAVNALVTVRWC